MADAPAAADRSQAVDISVERVARVYAQAILEAADKKNCRGEVIEELESLVRDVLPKVPRAGEVFASPKVPVEAKQAVIDRIAAGRMLSTTVHALHVLARHGRLGIVAQVAAAARGLADELSGLQSARFTTATPLSDDEQRQLVAEVEQAVGARLSPEFAVDPEMIGGLVVKIGDTVYDQSIATGLARLGGNLHRRTMHEIQYGRDRLTAS
ncbi:MAG: F-type ATPase subunit delta [Planctomycetota bacterium]|jgi:F-type H+-transporting ATPase subunit delta